MTKDTNVAPVEIQDDELESANGGLHNVIVTSVKNGQPMGVLIGQRGNNFLSGSTGNDT